MFLREYEPLNPSTSISFHDNNVTFTNNIHKITDLYNDFKNVKTYVDRDRILMEIGRLQIGLERLREKNMESD